MNTTDMYDQIDIYGNEYGIGIDIKTQNKKIAPILFELTIDEAKELSDMLLSAIVYHYENFGTSTNNELTAAFIPVEDDK